MFESKGVNLTKLEEMEKLKEQLKIRKQQIVGF